jgi:dipeptidyl-peptidase-4
MIFRALALTSLLLSIPTKAQLSSNMQNMIRRISAGEFGGDVRGGGGARDPRTDRERRWVDGGRGYTAIEHGDLVRYDTATGHREVLMSAKELTPPNLERPLSPSESDAVTGERMLFATSPRTVMIRKTANDYWVLDKTDGSWHKLGGKTNAGLLYAKLSPDGTRAAYVRSNNIYVEQIRGGAIKRLTSDGSPDIINGTSDWVNEEELSIRDAFEWSPDSRRIAFLQFNQSNVPEFTLINNTDTLYPVVTKYHYPKPGQTNSAVRLGIVSASGGSVRWMKAPGEPRSTYIPRFGWANSDEVIFQQLNRLQNTNNLWLANAKTGHARLLFQDRDDAWVDVHDVGNHTFAWFDNGASLICISERDGWRHAYAVSTNGNSRLITTGAFDLVSVLSVDEAGGWLYYIASPDNATQRYLYRSRLDGSGMPERVTPAGQPGTHTYNISPDGHWAFHTWSRFAQPATTEVVTLPEHKTARVLQDNAELKGKVTPLLTGRTEFFQVDIGGGVKLDGWLLKPSHLDESKKYPLIINVYGEPAATMANDSWTGTGRVLLAALADDGYLVASFDNRGTPAPKGRAWRKVVYRSIGILASKEQAAAVRAFAASRPYVDLDRVGVFGWSGGGSMTLNLLFRSPELYRVGVAGAPVPDETLYDSIYQERYMGLPSENSDGYKEGSPINFASGLRGKLLVIHGTGDDNVHFQGTQRLLNKLIELNKQFSFMEYPNRRHGISGEHLDTLRYGFLEANLRAGPATATPQEITAPTIASTSKASSPRTNYQYIVNAINDQHEPKSSGDRLKKHFDWWPAKGTNQWVEYDFAKSARVSEVEVYWFDDTGIGECRLPKSWQAFYRQNGEWKPVTNPSGYGCEGDRYNCTTFDPVETDGLRLDVQLPEHFSSGLLQWRVE